MVKNTKKFLQRTHKRAKKRAKFLLRHPFLLPVSLFFVIVFFGLGMFVTVGATTEGAQDKRIVDVYVDGEKQTVSTRAKTVGELLERLDISLIPEDIVEPARDAVILEDNTQVNVYRARSVSVIDRGRTLTVLSAQRAPRLLAHDAGLKLFPEDEAYFSRVDENVLAASAGEQLIINRSVPVQLNIYGAISKKRTTLRTVGEFIDQQDITIEEGATVQPADLTTPIASNMLIAINKIGIKTATVNEPIPFPTENREDPNLEVGQSRVEQAGVDGVRTVIYEITEEDGVEVGRREIQVVVAEEPVPEIRIRGKKPVTLSPSVNVSADKASLMLAAGIAASDHAYVDYIVSKESNWRPGALNAGSGAYGLCQSLPASKMASAGADYLTNPVTQLIWCNGYATGRYGSWQGAYNAWLAQGWW